MSGSTASTSSRSVPPRRPASSRASIAATIGTYPRRADLLARPPRTRWRARAWCGRTRRVDRARVAAPRSADAGRAVRRLPRAGRELIAVHREQQAFPRREAAVERSLAEAGGAGDRLHGRITGRLPRRRHDPQAIASRYRSWRTRCRDDSVCCGPVFVMVPRRGLHGTGFGGGSDRRRSGDLSIFSHVGALLLGPPTSKIRVVPGN